MPDTETTETTEQPKPDALGDAGKKALDAEREARRTAEKQLRETQEELNQMRPKADQYDALQESVKSDVQRANESAAEFKARAESEAVASAAVKLENLRYKISAKKGLDPELWDRVTGSNEEEITADVDKLVEKFSAPERKPIGALRSGASTASNADPKERAASALRAQWQNR